MARRALAQLDKVFSHRLEPELRVERRHAEHPCRRDVQLRRDQPEHVLREIAVNALRLLQDGNETAGDAAVCVQHRTQFPEFAVVIHALSLLI